MNEYEITLLITKTGDIIAHGMRLPPHLSSAENLRSVISEIKADLGSNAMIVTAGGDRVTIPMSNVSAWSSRRISYES